MLAGRFGGDAGGRKLCQHNALGGGLFDVLDERVVVARHRQAERLAACNDLAAVDVGITFLLNGQFGQCRAHVLVAQLAVAFLEAAPLFTVVPLALTRRVIHHRGKPKQRVLA